MTVNYNFDPRFERMAAALCLMKPTVWRRIGRHVEPEAMPTREAAIAFAIGREVAAAAGATGGLAVAYQAALGRVDDGDLSSEDLKQLIAYLEDGSDDIVAGDATTDAIVEGLVAAVQRRAKDVAAQGVIDGWAKGDPEAMDKHLEKVREAAKMGTVEDRGSEVSTLDQRIADIRRAGIFIPLETGYANVDALMGGGQNRGTVMIVGGGTGDGKSTALSSMCATAMTHGLFCAVGSTEVRNYVTTSRVDAALFNLAINDIRADPDIVRPYYEEHGDRIGPLCVRHFESPPGQKPSMSDVLDWVKTIEDNMGRRLEFLALDPMDRLKPSGKFKGNDYSAGEYVMDEIAQLTDERRLWTKISTHCQREKKTILWNENHFSDSQHKARRADDVWTVNFDKRQKTMTINYCKAREGGELGVVGPLPSAFSHGQLVAMKLLGARDEYSDL